jgi:hypothetical protein
MIRTSDATIQLIIESIEDFPFKEEYREELIQALFNKELNEEQVENTLIAMQNFWNF